MNQIHSFPPVWDENCDILILGSVPSVKSLEEGFFYGHPQNAFWKIMAEVFHETRPNSIQEKRALLKRNHIALWDVMAQCEREGSLDSAIRRPVPSDIVGLAEKLPRLKGILINGGTAYAMFMKHFAFLAQKAEVVRMPSTSPAYTLKYDKKRDVWRDTIEKIRRKNNMTPSQIIRKKRFGGELTREEIETFVRGIGDGTFADYQISALLMAICINGMTMTETRDLTMAMAHSGDMLDLKSIQGVKVDKHSTGGVGDTTSLILVPLVAAAGVKVAKMSGRGLGFTGGTLDKLESVPGLSVQMDADRFIDTVNGVGCAIIGQTADLAPADKVLYALRDVTETVDSLPLITSSILSKKIASGADVIVLDVKTGSGAIMPTMEKSVELAHAMVDIGNMTGRRFSALVTDMDQPLGMYVGNALEVEEAIDVLAGRTEGDLKEVSLQLAAHILKNAGRVETIEEGVALCRQEIADGSGLKKMAEMFRAQGGNPDVCYDTSLLPEAEKQMDICADRDGFIGKIVTREIGMAAKALGAGREHKEDVIDPAVGLVMKKRLGERVKKGDVLLTLHTGKISDCERAAELAKNAVCISDEPVEVPQLIHAVIMK